MTRWTPRVLVALAMTMLPFVVGALVADYLHPESLPASTGGATATQRLDLAIVSNPGNGLDSYVPANFTVPAHVRIVVTITNFDDDANRVPGDAARIFGTVGEVMTRDVDAAGSGDVVSGAIDNATVAHTFSVSGENGSIVVNVPVPPAKDANHPQVVAFTLEFEKAGTYKIFCRAHCDKKAMDNPGFMAGTLTVAA